MITIVQCVNNMDLGGTEQLVLSLVRALRARGFGTAICCIENAGALAAQAEASGTQVHPLQMQHQGKLRALHSLCDFLRHRQPVVIHSHNFKPFYYASLATLCGASNGHIHTRHGALLQHHRAVWRYRLLRRWVDAWVTVSADRQSELAERTGLPLAAIQVIGNGVDTNRFTPATDRQAVRRQLGLPVDVPAIVVAARLAPEKDFPTLLQAFRLVRQQLPTAELWFAGDGPERARLERTSNELKLSTATRFLGVRDDVNRLLQAADLFALSSLSEGLSMSLIEAAACGLPIVATAVGGNFEVVNPPAGGQLVPPANPPALAAALCEVLTNEPLRLAMSRAARQHALNQFSVERMVDGYVHLYRAALGKRGVLVPEAAEKAGCAL